MSDVIKLFPIFLILLLLIITSCFSKKKPYQTFKFQNYLSFTGNFDQKKSEEDFARLFPIGTDIDVVLKSLERSGMTCEYAYDGWYDWQNQKVWKNEYFCELKKGSHHFFLGTAINNNRKLLDFKIQHHNYFLN